MSDFLPYGDSHDIEIIQRNEAANPFSGSVEPIKERTFFKHFLRTPDKKSGHSLERDLEYPLNAHQNTKHNPLLSYRKTN